MKLKTQFTLVGESRYFVSLPMTFEKGVLDDIVDQLEGSKRPATGFAILSNWNKEYDEPLFIPGIYMEQDSVQVIVNYSDAVFLSRGHKILPGRIGIFDENRRYSNSVSCLGLSSVFDELTRLGFDVCESDNGYSVTFFGKNSDWYHAVPLYSDTERGIIEELCEAAMNFNADDWCFDKLDFYGTSNLTCTMKQLVEDSEAIADALDNAVDVLKEIAEKGGEN